jgi:hypothetical protein
VCNEVPVNEAGLASVCWRSEAGIEKVGTASLPPPPPRVKRKILKESQFVTSLSSPSTSIGDSKILMLPQPISPRVALSLKPPVTHPDHTQLRHADEAIGSVILPTVAVPGKGNEQHLKLRQTFRPKTQRPQFPKHMKMRAVQLFQIQNHSDLPIRLSVPLMPKKIRFAAGQMRLRG